MLLTSKLGAFSNGGENKMVMMYSAAWCKSYFRFTFGNWISFGKKVAVWIFLSARVDGK